MYFVGASYELAVPSKQATDLGDNSKGAERRTGHLVEKHDQNFSLGSDNSDENLSRKTESEPLMTYASWEGPSRTSSMHSSPADPEILPMQPQQITEATSLKGPRIFKTPSSKKRSHVIFCCANLRVIRFILDSDMSFENILRKLHCSACCHRVCQILRNDCAGTCTMAASSTPTLFTCRLSPHCRPPGRCKISLYRSQPHRHRPP